MKGVLVKIEFTNLKKKGGGEKLLVLLNSVFGIQNAS